MAEGAPSNPLASDAEREKARSNFNKYLKYYGIMLRKDMYDWGNLDWHTDFGPEKWHQLKFLHNICKVKKRHFEHLAKLAEAKRKGQSSFEDSNGKVFQMKDEIYHEDNAMKLWIEGILVDNEGNQKTTDNFKNEDGSMTEVEFGPYKDLFEKVDEMVEAQKPFADARSAETKAAKERAMAERVVEADTVQVTPGAGAAGGKKKKKKKNDREEKRAAEEAVKNLFENKNDAEEYGRRKTLYAEAQPTILQRLSMI
tara:strand:- start:92 stop:856 length:765 start_codon:yes stop_codon:yes gene_type:complete